MEASKTYKLGVAQCQRIALWKQKPIGFMYANLAGGFNPFNHISQIGSFPQG